MTKFLIYQYWDNIQDTNTLSAHHKSINSVKAYCAKYDIEYSLQTGDLDLLNGVPLYGIFLPFKTGAFKEYDAVCYIDSDVLITKTAQNVFECYDPERIVCLNRYLSKNHLKYGMFMGPYQKYREIGLLNTGVVLTPKKYFGYLGKTDLRPEHNKENAIFGEYDQVLFNKYIRHSCDFADLPNKYNYIFNTYDDIESTIRERHNQDFIHYAGKEKFLLDEDYVQEFILK